MVIRKCGEMTSEKLGKDIYFWNTTKFDKGIFRMHPVEKYVESVNNYLNILSFSQLW